MMTGRPTRFFANQLGLKAPIDPDIYPVDGGPVYQPINPIYPVDPIDPPVYQPIDPPVYQPIDPPVYQPIDPPVYNPPPPPVVTPATVPQATPPPSWAVGTFYGRDDVGKAVTLIITGAGNVTEYYHATRQGIWDGTRLIIGNNVWTLVQLANGIRTVNTNGGTTDFSRTAPPQNPPPTQTTPPTQPPGSNPTACTMDAKICPDGSSVGRTGPNCQFAACPEPSPQTAITDPLSILGMEISTETATMIGLGIAAVVAVLLLTGGSSKE
jgi:hypothetical protein